MGNVAKQQSHSYGVLETESEMAIAVSEPLVFEITKDGSLDFRSCPANKQKTGGWRAAPLIFGMELCERMASLGLQRNLVTYFVNQMRISIPTAANMVSNFVGVLYLTPFIGGFMADAYIGRFWAITLFGCIQLSGMILLTLSATLTSLRPPKCLASDKNSCPAAEGSQIAVLFVGLYFIALGNGGIKPNVSSMGADQFDENDPEESCHLSNFFNWFYFVISIGSLVSITVFVYLQDNVGFGWGFGIPSFLLLLAIIIFFAGAPLYRYKNPSGSPITRIAQVLVAAFRNSRSHYPSNTNELYEDNTTKRIQHTQEFRFLDKAAVIASNNVEVTSNKWKLCTVTQVEELKMVVRLIPIWASTFFVWTALAQMETFSVEQGAIMQRNFLSAHFQIPPASMSLFELLAVLIFLPLYDRYFVPLVRRLTGLKEGITSLQRIGVGIVASILSMVAAASIESRRVKVAQEHGLVDDSKAVIPMSIFWLTPQYFLRGTTEIFTQVGQLEFFYKQSPEGMRGFGTAVYLSTIAVGHFLSTAIVSAVNSITGNGNKEDGWIKDNLNKSKLSNFYWILAAISTVNLGFYVICSTWYTYKSLQPSESDEEHL